MTGSVGSPVGTDPPTVTSERRVEILGVAGAGKSTVVRLLGRRDGFEAAGFIHARRPSHLVQVARGVPRLIPILAAGLTSRPRMTWRELKLLVYVSRWQHVLRRRQSRSGSVLLFDQGPLYALVRLQAEGRPFTARRAFDRWRREMLERWARELDAVIWLDAPDEILWSRINDRPQAHGTKGREAQAGHRFIGRYRGAFEDLLSRLGEFPGPRVSRFDTSTMAPGEVADAIGAELLMPSGAVDGDRTVPVPERGEHRDGR